MHVVIVIIAEKKGPIVEVESCSTSTTITKLADRAKFHTNACWQYRLQLDSYQPMNGLKLLLSYNASEIFYNLQQAAAFFTKTMVTELQQLQQYVNTWCCNCCEGHRRWNYNNYNYLSPRLCT